MIEKEFFIKPTNIDITAATIGINKDDWYCHKPGMHQSDVREIMLLKNYDIVPIVDKQGFFRKYFTINKTNNSKLNYNDIQAGDRLYYLTHIRDVIWKMVKEKRIHFFLSNGREENDIVGLLSLSNFNCREFYVFLFNLIAYIEREFSVLVDSDKTKGFEILEKLSHTPESKEQLKIIQERFKQDENNQSENDYKEYLYLYQLIWLVKNEKKYLNLSYKTGESFESGTGLLKDLRNNIAHPAKSLVRNLEDLNKLNSGMNKLYDFKERLDKYLKSQI